jgi:tRNA threonylcarbamoyladenosine biosynthesis protein TsaB
MVVLGIETATSVCAAAVLGEAGTVHEAVLDGQYIHSEKLLGLIDEVLQSSAIAASDVHGIAVSIGPGSFTGLRIGLSVAKGLAYALDKPLVAVPTLQALAQAAADRGMVADGRKVLATIDARRDEVYCQLFSTAEGVLRTMWDAKDMRVSEVLKAIEELEVVTVGDGAGKLSALHRNQGNVKILSPEQSRCSAASVAKIGAELLAHGQVADIAQVEPLYVKEFYTKVR